MVQPMSGPPQMQPTAWGCAGCHTPEPRNGVGRHKRAELGKPNHPKARGFPAGLVNGVRFPTVHACLTELVYVTDSKSVAPRASGFNSQDRHQQLNTATRQNTKGKPLWLSKQQPSTSPKQSRDRDADSAQSSKPSDPTTTTTSHKWSTTTGPEVSSQKCSELTGTTCPSSRSAAT